MPETIEAEVIEIDGNLPPDPMGRDPQPRFGGQDMRRMVLTLNRRWWPLWVVLGVLAVILAVAVGLVVGSLFLLLSIVRRVFRFFLGGFARSEAGSATLGRGL